MTIHQMLLGGAAETGYNLQRSLRFRASASAYLNRTPASAGNRQIWTYSTWVKKSQILADSTDQFLFHAYAGSGASVQTGIAYSSYSPSGIVDSIRIQSGTQGVSQDFDFAFANTYRDPAAWYHIVVAFDTTQATASNRIKVYVNGNQLGTPVSYAGRATTVSQNYQTAINSNISHNIGRNVSASSYFDGYLADTYFVDGQALTPASFGETNALTGVWQPKAYTGSYGTNGFYLPFTDNSALTTSSNVGLGKDFSGNGNYWTTNNISITSGVTYDSMTDVPTLTSATAANYAVLNPLSTNATLSDGNLGTWSPITQCGACSTTSIPNAKIYYEVIPNSTPVSLHVGVIAENPTIAQLSTTANADSVLYRGDGGIFRNTGGGFTQVQTVASYTNGDVIGCAVDIINRTVQYYKNNTAVGTTVSLTSSINYTAWLTFGATSVGSTVNFGQRPFAYTPPTGFVALNTFNLPAATIVKGNTVMDATLYTGTAAAQTIANAAAFYPDFVWGKQRSGANNNIWVDSNRGATNFLVSNTNGAEATNSAVVSAIGSTGFTLGTDGTINGSGQTNVAWQWNAGSGSTSSNTDGAITSTVSVNAAAGFSIAKFTTQASGVSTFGHGLGVAPAFYMVTSRPAVSGRNTYHKSIGATQYLQMNTTAAAVTDSTLWNNTAPTSSVITIGTAFAGGSTAICYAWSEIDGFSKFGAYVGNSNADGPFIYCGFRPKFVLFKGSSFSNNWYIIDSTTNSINVAGAGLIPNADSAETATSTTQNAVDFLSNGFKLRNNASAVAFNNSSGQTFIYAAFAENPFKHSLAR